MIKWKRSKHEIDVGRKGSKEQETKPRKQDYDTRPRLSILEYIDRAMKTHICLLYTSRTQLPIILM
jgi:hypothetical protein